MVLAVTAEGNEIFQHFDVIRIYNFLLKLYFCHLSLTGDSYLYSSTSCSSRKFFLFQSFLVLFHLALHFLRLFHKIIHISRHTHSRESSTFCHL